MSWQLADPPYWDDKIESLVVAQTGEYLVSISRMIYTERIVITGLDEYPSCYTAGWDFEPGAAVAAAQAWNPDNEWEPKGYIRVACDARQRTS